MPTARRPLASLALCALLAGPAAGDDGAPAAPPAYMDRKDLLEWMGLKRSRGVLEPYELYPAIIPSVGYTPQNGVVVGVTTLAGIYLGDPDTTTISSLGLVALYTSKNQVILQSRDVLVLEANRWQIHLDWRLLLTSQVTYGLGSGAESADQAFTVGGWGATGTLAGEQPMDFDLVRLHQVGLRRVAGPFFAGLSYRLDRYFGIVDRRLDLGAIPPVVTSHEAYSRAFGFGSKACTSSGLGLELVYDSRDSTINAYRGWYLNASLRAYPEALGSARDATYLFGEARTYLGLSRSVPRNVLALWVMGQGVTSGELPYLALPSVGWDFGNRSGRGYVQGRFRGTGQLYAEAEWRFRLSENGMLGGTVFANAATWTRPAVEGVPGEELFDRIRPAGGFGLRFMMNREARNNVTLDLGFGQGSFGVWFGAGEVF